MLHPAGGGGQGRVQQGAAPPRLGARRSGRGRASRTGSGKSEVQYLRNDIRRLKEELHARELLWQCAAELIDIFLRRMMVLWIERYLDLRIAAADNTGITIGQIES